MWGVITVVIIVSIVWVLFDSKRRDLTQTSHGPVTTEVYMIGMVLLWIVFFPIYLLFGWKAPLRASAPRPVAADAAGPSRFKQCPDCAETILAEANVCKHCHYRFDSPTAIIEVK